MSKSVKQLEAELAAAMKMGTVLKEALVEFTKELVAHAMVTNDIDLAAIIKQTYEGIQDEVAAQIETIAKGK